MSLLEFSKQDIRLLQYIATVAAMSHCPFIASVGPKFFGIDDFNELPKIKDLESHFYGVKYIKWQSFREMDDARYVALAMPRFLLRLSYDSENNPVKGLNYNENVSGSHEHYLWGNAAFAFASNLTKSFAKYRLCVNIIGPKLGGNVDDLFSYQFDSMGGPETNRPTEVHLSDRREYELSEQGFMGLAMRRGSGGACFFSANSVQKPKNFPDTPEGRKELSDYKLVAQLPYLFIITRFAHYIKVLHRINLRKWRYDKELLQDELNNWIGRYVMFMHPLHYIDDRPYLFRTADIVVKDLDYDGYNHQYLFLLNVSPRLKYMGEYFNLSLRGILG